MDRGAEPYGQRVGVMSEKDPNFFSVNFKTRLPRGNKAIHERRASAGTLVKSGGTRRFNLNSHDSGFRQDEVQWVNQSPDDRLGVTRLVRDSSVPPTLHPPVTEKPQVLSSKTGGQNRKDPTQTSDPGTNTPFSLSCEREGFYFPLLYPEEKERGLTLSSRPPTRKSCLLPSDFAITGRRHGRRRVRCE